MPRLDRRDMNRINLIINKTTGKVGKNSVKFFKKNFRKGGKQDRVFQRWQRLKAQSVQAKVRKYGTNKGVLRGSDRLLNSIRILRHNRNRVVVGTDVAYGKFHQNQNYSPNPPTRQFLYNSEDLHRENIDIINDELLKLFKLKE